ncbi:MAG: DUF370 domain-containing protein [Deltaproteobacteria bacterium]|jgi:regulator of extracellular matrix RemA (YlzA/DUF370 family)|nr:DUF370 domain-containing protein [Deltaproteobacteria bacterium]
MPELFIGIGHGNAAQASQVVAILNPASAPVARLRAEARQAGRLLDASQGRRTRSVLVMASGHVIESALEVRSLTEKFNRAFQAREDAARP